MKLLARLRIKIHNRFLTSEILSATAVTNSKNSWVKKQKKAIALAQEKHSSSTTIFARDVSSSNTSNLIDTRENLSDCQRIRCHSQM